MDVLGWLSGRKDGDGSRRIASLHRQARGLLPDDEDYVVRYVLICSILLARVAHADGVLVGAEKEHLMRLLEACGRVEKARIVPYYEELDRLVPLLTEGEIAACCRELRSLCDTEQRRQVIRLLMGQAVSDGKLAPSEHQQLGELAEALGIDRHGLAEIDQARTSQQAPEEP